MARWDKGTTASTIPDWFFEAVEAPVTDHTVEVEECDVHYRLWEGSSDRPLLLIHGMSAHAHWFDFIAPQLTPEYRVAAMDLTGMGDSDYRYEYTADSYAEEVRAVCDAAALDERVILVAHSFGGRIALKAVKRWPDRFAGLVLLDSGLRHPDEPDPQRPPMAGSSKVYPDRASAEARFRLQPPQSCDNGYILEYIARHSIMAVEGGGFAWKFDEDLFGSLKGLDGSADDFRNLAVPLKMMFGADSALFSERSVEYMQSLVPEAQRPVPVVMLPDAQHHLFLDQPRAFVAALRDLLTD
ncbi:MAG: alpha/beta hydrolase [Pseudomonadota bacterium]